MPNEKYRTGYWLGKKEKVKDPDKEANFTVIAGYLKYKNIWIHPNYHGILLEIKFMTNKNDLLDLHDNNWKYNLKHTLLKCFDNIINY